MLPENSSLKSATKSILNDLSKHALTLSTGLQNAAPPQADGSPNKSVLYLSEISKELTELSRSMDFTPSEED